MAGLREGENALWRSFEGPVQEQDDAPAAESTHARIVFSMKIGIDDWHFRDASEGAVVVDAYLDNGQRAVLEVNPMKNAEITNGDIPEIIVFCEMPGERVSEQGCPARWLSRPPSKECPWSGVQLPHALMEQIRDRLGQRATAATL